MSVDEHTKKLQVLQCMVLVDGLRQSWTLDLFVRPRRVL
jgi:hypothetical protein